MKTSGVFKAVAFMTVGSVCLSTVALGDSRDSSKLVYPYGKTKDKYVFVTGSHIPQKVQVKSIGTASQSPVRVYGRTELDRTNTQSTRALIAMDPAVQFTTGH